MSNNPFKRRRTVADRMAETDVVRIVRPVKDNGYLFVVGKADTPEDNLVVMVERRGKFWYRFWNEWTNCFPCYQKRVNFKKALADYQAGRTPAAPEPTAIAMLSGGNPELKRDDETIAMLSRSHTYTR